MTFFWRLILFLAIAASLFGPTLGRAFMQGAVMEARGGGASPKSRHHNIRMDSQEVTIRLRKHSYTVDAVFHLFNTGETTTEWIGFPNRATDDSDFFRFDAWVEGRKVKVAEETYVIGNHIFSGKHNLNRWMAIQAAFPGNASIAVRTSYEASYEPVYDNSSRPEIQYWCAYFQYGTSSLWKGDIGKVVFIIDGSAIGGKHGFKVDISNRHHWHELASETSKMLTARNINPDPQEKLVVSRQDIHKNFGEHQKEVGNPLMKQDNNISSE